MKKKLLNICLLMCLMTSCKNTSNTTSPSKSNQSNSTQTSETSKKSSTSPTPTEYHVSKKLDTSKVYISEDKSFALPTTFFTEVVDVPYVELNDFYVNFFGTNMMESSNFFSVNSGTVTNTFTKSTLVFDTVKNTISSSDLDQFTNFTNSIKTSLNIISTPANNLSKLNEEKTTYKKGKAMTFDLNHYNMNLIKYQDKIYVPFSILETTSFTPIFVRFAFNGDDYYYTSSTGFLDSKTKGLTSFGTKYANGSLFKNKTRSESYANYFYYSLLFELENYEGHYSRLNIQNLDEKLSELGFKEKLLSTDSDVANKAYADVINQVFHDGGHTAFTNRGFTSEYSYETDESLMKEILNYDTRYYNTMLTFATLGQQIMDNPPSTLEYSTDNETAVIHLSAFTMHNALNLENIDEDQISTFSILYHSFKKISEKTTVKNVIFDVSLNGGGAAPALAEALSFITDDPVEMTVTNMSTGAVLKEAVDIDNNLDGNFTDNDSYSGKFNFYILTSGFSFSCANAFPAIAKEKGYAKIIGQKSGGGDCAVLNGITVDGGNFNMSSNYSITKKDGTDVDSGVEVDYEIDYSNFFKIDYLANAIKSVK